MRPSRRSGWTVADHPWLGPVVGTRLAVVVRRDPLETCETCDGNGVYLDEDGEYDCPCAEDSYRDPTPADLLTDPRVQALVEAVELLRDWPDQYPRHHSALMKALAPFEVDRG